MRLKFAVLLLAIVKVAAVNAQGNSCAWEIEIENHATKEVSYYRPSTESFEIPLEGLTGFSACTVPPVFHFKSGSRPVQMARIFCFSGDGQMVGGRAVSWPGGNSNYSRFEFYGIPAQLNPKQNYRVEASDGRSVTLHCK